MVKATVKGQGMRKHRNQHEHLFRIHGVGAGLQRAVCTECNHISIRTIEDGGVRAMINKPDPLPTPAPAPAR